MILNDFKASSKASEGLVARFILLYFLSISTISNGLVGMPELSSSTLVEESIEVSSIKYSAFNEYPLKKLEGIKKIIKGIDLKRFLKK